MILQSGVSYWRCIGIVAAAIAYAQQQAKVVVVGRRIDEGEETVRLIKEASEEAFLCKQMSRKKPMLKQWLIKRFGRD